MLRAITVSALLAAALSGCGSSGASPSASSGASGGASGSSGSGAGGASGGFAGGGTGGQAACAKSGDMPFVWAKSVSKESAGILGMALGPDDAIYLTGLYSSTLTLGVGQAGQAMLQSLLGSRDAFVAKLAPDGTLVWAKSAGGTADDSGNDIAVASDGSLRVVGTFEGTGLFGAGEPGETQLQANGSPDLFVARLSNDGTLTWAKRASASTVGGGSFGSAIAKIAGDGSLRVVGGFNGTITFGPGETNQTSLTSVLPAGDMFLASYGAGGALAWVKRVEGTQLAGGNPVPGRGVDLAVAQDGTTLVIATGNIKFAPGESNETSLGGPGVNVARYDGTGTLIDAQARGGGGQLGAAKLAADGSLYLGGMFTDTITFGSGEPTQTTLAGSAFVDAAELFLAKLAADGSLAWAKQATLGTKGSLAGLGVAADGSFRALAQYFNGALLGPGELNAVKLTAGSGLIANFGADGAVISAKDVSSWHSASNLPPAPPFMHALSLSASDGSLRVLGYVGTSDPITLGEGEPGATIIDGVSNFVAKYSLCP